MKTGEILGAIRAAGVAVRVEHGSIIAGPKARVTDNLRCLIKENKSALLEVLATNREADVALVAVPVREEPCEDYSHDDLAEMDRLIRQLAQLERWTADELRVCLEERRRMAPANVVQALRTLRDANQNALALKATQQTRAQFVLCRLAPRRCAA